MGENMQDYGLWGVVIVNAAVFIIFAFSFSRPRTARDWRSFGAFSAFLVALFTEMYGFPLTIYLLSGWLGSVNPATNLFAHNSGHIWQTLFGWQGDPHENPLHLISDTLLAGGFLLLAIAWPVLYRAQRAGKLATGGVYAVVRHPQYVGFIVIMFSLLLEWPTILTAVMFPVLVTMYLLLARREEGEAMEAFGEEYARYAAVTPAFLPRPHRVLARLLASLGSRESIPETPEIPGRAGQPSLNAAPGKAEEHPASL
jgi:protein-S-isoprenylcysteine O-methyltransferase Ste14